MTGLAQVKMNLPATRAPQFVNRILQPRDIELGGYWALTERSKPDKQRMAAKELFDQGNGTTATPEAQRAIVSARVEIPGLCRTVIHPVFDLAVALKAGCQMAIGMNDEASGILKTANHQRCRARRPKPIAGQWFFGTDRHIDVGRILEIRLLRLNLPFAVFFRQILNGCISTEGLVIAGKPIEVVFDRNASTRIGKSRLGKDDRSQESKGSEFHIGNPNSVRFIATVRHLAFSIAHVFITNLARRLKQDESKNFPEQEIAWT
nr:MULTISPECIES: hypothetical protein [unclassified Mameliella]